MKSFCYIFLRKSKFAHSCFNFTCVNHCCILLSFWIVALCNFRVNSIMQLFLFIFLIAIAQCIFLYYNIVIARRYIKWMLLKLENE
nr:MAG TPA: hypothetical protein [Caudoviricetes sp.]